MRPILRCLLSRHRDDRGVAAVEFSLVAIPVALLMLAIFDLGLGIWNYNSLSEAVREGGRYAVVRGQSTSLPGGPAGPATEGPVACSALGSEKVAPVVCQYAFALDPSALQVTVSWDGGSNTVGSPVTVSAAYQYTPILTSLFSLTINMKSQTRMLIACCD